MVRFFFYIDDRASKSSLRNFQYTSLVGGIQPTGPLAHFQSVLGGLYKHWDPICANFMASAAFDFISGTVLERRSDIIHMEIRPSAGSWPGYLRVKTGMAPGFSCAAFIQDSHPDITTYIQALPDIDEYLCLVNDILSCVPSLTICIALLIHSQILQGRSCGGDGELRPIARQGKWEASKARTSGDGRRG